MNEEKHLTKQISLLRQVINNDICRKETMEKRLKEIKKNKVIKDNLNLIKRLGRK